MNNKGQAIIEYLMAYGWALIVIAITVGVVTFIVINGADFVEKSEPDEWIGEWRCEEFKETIVNVGEAAFYCMELCMPPITWDISPEEIESAVEVCINACYVVEKECVSRVWVEELVFK